MPVGIILPSPPNLPATRSGGKVRKCLPVPAGATCRCCEQSAPLTERGLSPIRSDGRFGSAASWDNSRSGGSGKLRPFRQNFFQKRLGKFLFRRRNGLFFETTQSNVWEPGANPGRLRHCDGYKFQSHRGIGKAEGGLKPKSGYRFDCARRLHVSGHFSAKRRMRPANRTVFDWTR